MQAKPRIFSTYDNRQCLYSAKSSTLGLHTGVDPYIQYIRAKAYFYPVKQVTKTTVKCYSRVVHGWVGLDWVGSGRVRSEFSSFRWVGSTKAKVLKI